MPRCASTKNAKSTDQCPAPALLGHTCCGRHRRVRVPRLWIDVNRGCVTPAVRIQSLFRAWKVRRYLKLCGPGVLKREACVNDDDLNTTIEKTRQDPFDYFGLEEAGKVWWFDFGTIWTWSMRTLDPLNPYTNVALTHDVKQRLKKVWILRKRYGYAIPSEAGVLTSDRIARRWILLCQVFRSYGFDDVHPNLFAEVTDINLLVMFRTLYRDIAAMPRPSHRAMVLCRRGMINAHKLTTGSYMMTSLNGLVFMLTESSTYDMVFLTLSALYRC